MTAHAPPSRVKPPKLQTATDPRDPRVDSLTEKPSLSVCHLSRELASTKQNLKRSVIVRQNQQLLLLLLLLVVIIITTKSLLLLLLLLQYYYN